MKGVNFMKKKKLFLLPTLLMKNIHIQQQNGETMLMNLKIGNTENMKLQEQKE